MRMQRKGAGSRVRAARTGTIVGLAALVLVALEPSTAFAAGKLEIMPDVPMLLALILLFAVLIFPVNSLVFKPIFRALDERAARIEGARQRAEQIGEDADAVLARYESAIREARTSAEASRKEMVTAARGEQANIAAAARGDAESLVDQARRELDAALGEAREGLRASSQELGRAAAERILGRGL